jgi:hypothetical protein
MMFESFLCGKQKKPMKLISSEQINVNEDWVGDRWPTRLFYGRRGELSHPYTRMKTPNLRQMTCWYRCKSYRTFGCDAKLKLTLVGGPTGESEWTLSGHHTQVCQNKNGIASSSGASLDENKDNSKIVDISEKFKNRLTELAVEKIWLAPMKIWSMVREEIVGEGGGGAVTIPNSDVVSKACFCEKKLNTCLLVHVHSLTLFCPSLLAFPTNVKWSNTGAFMSFLCT